MSWPRTTSSSSSPTWVAGHNEWTASVARIAFHDGAHPSTHQHLRKTHKRQNTPIIDTRVHTGGAMLTPQLLIFALRTRDDQGRRLDQQNNQSYNDTVYNNRDSQMYMSLWKTADALIHGQIDVSPSLSSDFWSRVIWSVGDHGYFVHRATRSVDVRLCWKKRVLGRQNIGQVTSWLWTKTIRASCRLTACYFELLFLSCMFYYVHYTWNEHPVMMQNVTREKRQGRREIAQ